MTFKHLQLYLWEKKSKGDTIQTFNMHQTSTNEITHDNMLRLCNCISFPFGLWEYLTASNLNLSISILVLQFRNCTIIEFYCNCMSISTLYLYHIIHYETQNKRWPESTKQRATIWIKHNTASQRENVQGLKRPRRSNHSWAGWITLGGTVWKVLNVHLSKIVICICILSKNDCLDEHKDQFYTSKNASSNPSNPIFAHQWWHHRVIIIITTSTSLI